MQYKKLKIVVNIIFLILIIVIGVLGVFLLWKAFVPLWKAFMSLDQKLIAAILVPSGALMAAIIAAALTHYYTKKREIAETHRLRKSEIYTDFVQKVLAQPLQIAKQKQSQQEITEHLEDVIFNFVGALIVWGSPSVIHAYRQFQKSAYDNPEMLLSLMDNLLQEIRKDLGHSNKGLKQYDLYNLFLKGDEDIQNLNE